MKEYFLYDPRGEYLTPRLQGYRLVDGGYERMAAVESIDRTLTLPSEVLGLELRAKGEEMHFHNPATGQVLLSHGEEHSERRAAEIRAEEETAAYRTVLARAEQEAAARREEAAARREEAAARRAAEARVAELEAILREKSR